MITSERRLIVKGWKVEGYNNPNRERRQFTSMHHGATDRSLAFERARIGEKGLPDWQPHVTEVYMEEREVTEWRKVAES